MSDLAAPQLSVVVVIVSDTTDSRREATHLGGCLDALSSQIDPPLMEIIVPYKPPVEGIDDLKQRFPQVLFIRVGRLEGYVGKAGGREHHDELRAHGLAAAQSNIIGLLEDHARPDPHWCARVVEAHGRRYPNYAAVGGAIENGIDLPLNWAVYFCDFGRYQNPVPEGESHFASDANISYKRTALETVKEVWQESFHETAVNWALASRGEKLALAGDIIVYQHRKNLRFGNALMERFIWGRSYAATRSLLTSGIKRLMYAALSPLLPAILLARMAVMVVKRGRHLGPFLKALPLIALLTMSWACGELVGYMTAGTGTFPALATDATTRI